MTRNAASKCNNKYLSASKSCVLKNYADLTCIYHMKYRARNRIEIFYDIESQIRNSEQGSGSL